MKRFLIFSLAYIPLIGGAEIAVKEITDRLGADYEWDMITLRPNRLLPRFERIGNVNVYRVGLASSQSADLTKIGFAFKISKALYPILAFFKAASLYRQRKYNATWSIMAAYAGLAGLFFKTLYPDVPFILTLQEGDTATHVKKRAGIFAFLLRLIYKKADRIQAISKYLIDFAREFGCQKDIVVIPNGVDLVKFTEAKKVKQPGQLRIITTSRLVEKNGIADLILALTYLPENYNLDILGSGPLKDSLISLVKEKKLDGRVNFVGGLNQSEVVSYLNSADVFVRASLSEGLGNSFLEAMAVGLPIIGTKVGGIVDFLIDGETGLFCEINNPESIADKVRLITSDQNLQSKLKEQGKKLVMEKYDWNLLAKRFKTEVFDKIA